MAQQLKCDCCDRIATSVNSFKIFEELKAFFDNQVNKEIFKEITPEVPYYSWKNNDGKMEWYATKWYICNSCECLWEFNYPDFPAKGFVRKFPDGIYKPSKVVVDGEIKYDFADVTR